MAENTGDMIRLPHAECTIEINDTPYTFKQFISFTFTDPRQTTVLASPQGTGAGLTVKSGLTQASTVQTIVRDVPAALQLKMIEAFENDERVRFNIVDLQTQKVFSMSDAVFNTNPAQGTINEGEETYNIPVNLHCAPNRVRNAFKQ